MGIRDFIAKRTGGNTSSAAAVATTTEPDVEAEAPRAPDIPVGEVHAGVTSDTITLIDVREQVELETEGRVDAAIHIPMNDVPAHLARLQKIKQPLVIMCRSGIRSGNVADWLLAQGCEDVSNMEGGIIEWRHQGLPYS